MNGFSAVCLSAELNSLRANVSSLCTITSSNGFVPNLSERVMNKMNNGKYQNVSRRRLHIVMDKRARLQMRDSSDSDRNDMIICRVYSIERTGMVTI